jgi:hypothetical protein
VEVPFSKGARSREATSAVHCIVPPLIKSRKAIRVDKVWDHMSRVPDKAGTVDVVMMLEGACLETHHDSSG